MKLVVTIEGTETLLNVDISDDMSLEDFKAYLEAETDISPENQVILHNSKELTDSSSNLKDLGLKDDELLVLRSTATSNQSQQLGGGLDLSRSDEQIEAERQALLRDPLITQNASDPRLSSILNNPQLFRNFIRAAQGAQSNNNTAFGGFGGLGTEPLYQQEITRLRSLPDTAENRKKIEDLQDLQNIEENRMLAYEMAPETFTQVPMLYINMEVNKVPVKAFVDTGAQMTLMSPALLEKCGLHKLIDKRFRGEARGVGSGAILGRIHSAPVKIEDLFIPCSFAILDSGVELILGLDMLRRHQANVNLKDMCLYISDVKTPFLGEGEIKDSIFSGQNHTSPGTVLGGESKKPKLGDLASAAASAASARANNTASDDLDPVKLDQLIGLGFSKSQAITALKQCNGNVDLAASLLFQ